MAPHPPCRQVKRLLKKQLGGSHLAPRTSSAPGTIPWKTRQEGGGQAKSETGSASPEETPMGPPAQWRCRTRAPEEAYRGGRAAAPLPAEGGWGRQAALGLSRTLMTRPPTTRTTPARVDLLSQLHHLLPERSGASRKKSIPLSIKNLKRKHKRKKNNKSAAPLQAGGQVDLGHPLSRLGVQPEIALGHPHTQAGLRVHTWSEAYVLRGAWGRPGGMEGSEDRRGRDQG